MASHWVGLTLPGMIELPGSFAGSFSSPSPQRGPEPEARGSRVSGLAFHKFYFDLGGGGGADPTTSRQTTLVEPRCRLVGADGSAAVVTYLRLVQQHGGPGSSGAPTTAKFEETRMYEQREGNWICVHFHRSVVGE